MRCGLARAAATTSAMGAGLVRRDGGARRQPGKALGQRAPDRGRQLNGGQEHGELNGGGTSPGRFPRYHAAGHRENRGTQPLGGRGWRGSVSRPSQPLRKLRMPRRTKHTCGVETPQPRVLRYRCGYGPDGFPRRRLAVVRCSRHCSTSCRSSITGIPAAGVARLPVRHRRGAHHDGQQHRSHSCSHQRAPLPRQRGILHCIPERRDQRERRTQRPGRKPNFERDTGKRRNVLERCNNRLKQVRGLATRYKKRDAKYRAMVDLAALLLWLPT
jgi:transposase